MSAEISVAESTGLGILTPVQWHAGRNRQDARFQSTKQLMLAILTDALQCLQNEFRCNKTAQRRVLAETKAWIAERNEQGPFAFETVCEALQINPEWLRKVLKEWRQKEYEGVSTPKIRRSPLARRSSVRKLSSFELRSTRLPEKQFQTGTI